MNKYVYALTVAASVLMLPGCSNEDGMGLEGGNDLPVYVAGDSEVEILLGSKTESSVTVNKRAALEGNSDIEDLGVFCLAREKQDINEGAYDINWFDEEENWSGCLMQNVKAVKTGNDVAWADPSKHYYYPISQFYRYDFFGYYPYVEGGNISMTDNRVRVTYALDGTTDVIWGRATSDEPHAYSAAYFRQPGNEGKYPLLDLKHVLVRLKFQVKPGAQIEGGDEVASAMEDYAVAKVQVVNVPATGILTVADFSRMDEIDETNCFTGGYELTDYTLRKADGTPMDTTMVGMDMDVETPLGESVMVIPAREYVIRVHLVNVETGDVFITEHPLKLTNSSLFQQGYTYTVTITAHEPKEIQLQANLNGWIDADDSPFVDL